MTSLNKLNNLEKLFDELFSICRSITGEGYRKSLKIHKNIYAFQKLKNTHLVKKYLIGRCLLSGILKMLL